MGSPCNAWMFGEECICHDKDEGEDNMIQISISSGDLIGIIIKHLKENTFTPGKMNDLKLLDMLDKKDVDQLTFEVWIKGDYKSDWQTFDLDDDELEFEVRVK